jgi:hypothetical protein
MSMLTAFHCKSLSGLIGIAEIGGSMQIPPLTSRVWIDIGPADNPILPPDDSTFLLLIEALPQVAQHLRERFDAAVSSSNGLALFRQHKETGHLSSLDTVSTWLPTGVGLGSVPLIVHPTDNAVDWFMDSTLRTWDWKSQLAPSTSSTASTLQRRLSAEEEAAK